MKIGYFEKVTTKIKKILPDSIAKWVVTAIIAVLTFIAGQVIQNYNAYADLPRKVSALEEKLDQHSLDDAETVKKIDGISTDVKALLNSAEEQKLTSIRIESKIDQHLLNHAK